VQTVRNSFYWGRVIANFVPKFVAMATGVDRGKILMTPSDSAGPKIGGVRANSAQLSFTGAELQPILSQNSLPWQRGLAGEKF